MSLLHTFNTKLRKHFSNPFNSARFKITSLYLLIIALISFSFSLVIFRFVSFEIDRFANSQRQKLERRFELLYPSSPAPLIEFDQDILFESKLHFRNNLLLLNLVILSVSGFLSYYLAGRTLEPIEKMLQDQRRFVADASHELKTPLTSLKTALEVYLRSPKVSPKETKELIEDNLHEVNRLQKLTQNLLDLTHHSNPKTLSLQPLNLSSLLLETLSSIKPLADNKKITLSKKIQPNLTVKGDIDSLKSLFTILLDNAIKYSPPHKKVTLVASQKGRSIFVKVVDQGIGIDPQDQPHIFSRFYRADQSRSKTKVEGFGLGLSIAKDISDLHRSHLSFVSKPNKGTTFTITFPKSA